MENNTSKYIVNSILNFSMEFVYINSNLRKVITEYFKLKVFQNFVIKLPLPPRKQQLTRLQPRMLFKSRRKM